MHQLVVVMRYKACENNSQVTEILGKMFASAAVAKCSYLEHPVPAEQPELALTRGNLAQAEVHLSLLA